MKNKILYIFIYILTIFSLNFNRALCNQILNIDNKAFSLAPIIKKTLPSVVNIYSEGYIKKIDKDVYSFFSEKLPFCQNESPYKNLPLCKKNKKNKIKPKLFQTIGAGVIINSDKGYIITNYHVVMNSDKIQIVLNDGRRYSAKIIGIDNKTDIALLKLNIFKDLKSIKIANSDKIKIGDYVIAIGNPYGLGETATSGIISALGRSGLNIENYENFIQTDAAINKGNSGGALINLNGELIGLNTAILAPTGGNIGIGFAIPSNIIKNIISQLTKFGKMKRGELGISGTELIPEISDIMNVKSHKGAFINEVYPKSSAENAGINAGDIIIMINDKYIDSFSSLRAQIGSMSIGSKFTLGIVRKGKFIKIIVILKENSSIKIHLENVYFNMFGAELSNYKSIKIKGLFISKVEKYSKAEKSGLKKNDIIISVNEKPTKDINDLKNILYKKPEIILLKILRYNRNIYIIIR